MAFGDLRAAADRARETPLEGVLVRSGAERDREDPAKWRTARGTLSVNGRKFMNWRLGVGGGGAIDLVMHLQGLGFRSAVEWLEGVDRGRPAWTRPAAASGGREFRLPAADAGGLHRVIGYLQRERGLPASLIDPLVAAGTLYADGRGNAVFLLLDAERRPVGAELRGTSPRRWRGMAPGSRKDGGYFSIPAPGARALVLCESAIDAMSGRALWPDRLCVSTSGARANPGWLPALLRGGTEVYCGFDSDAAGDEKGHALIALHPAVKRLRPAPQDWNDVLRARG